MPAVVPFETAPQLLRRLAEHYAGTGKAALGHKDKATKAWTDLTWDDLDAQVRAFAGFLHARGVGKGDRVAILSENRPEWAVADMAAQQLGAVTVALYTTTPASQVAYVLRDSGATVLVVSTGLQLRKADRAFDDCPDLRSIVSMAAPRKARPDVPVVTWDDALSEGERQSLDLDALSDEVGPDDLSALIYTSGTTGDPKGVRMTHRNLMSNVHAALDRYDIHESDVHLSFLPLSHAFERTAGYTTILAAGGQIVYAESIDAVSKNLPEVRPTVMVSVPRLFERVYSTIQRSVAEGSVVKRGLFAWAVEVGSKVAQRTKAGKTIWPPLRAQHALAHRLVFSTLHEKLGGRVRFAISGGAALPEEIGTFFEAAGIRLIEGYGLSETAPVLAANPFDAPIYGTVGWVMPGVTVAIRALDSGRILAEVEGDDYPTDVTTGPGEILAKGPNVMAGYWERPEESAAAFDADGWFRTGDVGRFEGGYLRITDRLKHMIVTGGGKNVYPGPIESTLSTSPLVSQLMVVGEGRPYLTALVAPDLDGLRQEAGALGLGASTEAELLAAPELRAAVEQTLADYNRAAPSHEKVRDFRFVAEPFTVENDLLTPTMKLKRRAIEAHYADLVESMYERDR
ncbi:AMP-dependent synthetase/ligase [Rubrivirga marina]|uniref:Long-chain fatty acid--CoA ligase n=1 Tax=Rubrivirga marina TaxID=1196024 RepID=A0A271J0C3_9BACT|nr:long-chain fatty acid--CoA ligase [Rubrivirga marina]PAP76688.1 long-chain fatty acid--CoA ligase [Rubrivirga marina]